MKRCIVNIQDKSLLNDQISEMETAIRSLYRKFYGKPVLAIILWNTIPEGYAFTDAKPSNSTLLMVEVEEGISMERRREFMQMISDRMMSEFNIHPHELVMTVAETSFVSRFLKLQREKIRKDKRFSTVLKMMSRAARNRISQGFWKIDQILK